MLINLENSKFLLIFVIIRLKQKEKQGNLRKIPLYKQNPLLQPTFPLKIQLKKLFRVYFPDSAMPE
jgi:hypothetical protein